MKYFKVQTRNREHFAKITDIKWKEVQTRNRDHFAKITDIKWKEENLFTKRKESNFFTLTLKRINRHHLSSIFSKPSIQRIHTEKNGGYNVNSMPFSYTSFVLLFFGMSVLHPSISPLAIHTELVRNLATTLRTFIEKIMKIENNQEPRQNSEVKNEQLFRTRCASCGKIVSL